MIHNRKIKNKKDFLEALNLSETDMRSFAEEFFWDAIELNSKPLALKALVDKINIRNCKDTKKYEKGILYFFLKGIETYREEGDS